VIPDEDLAAFQEASSDAWIWTGADGIVRLMMAGSPDPAQRIRVFEIEDGLLAAVRYAPMPPGVGSTSFVDTTGIPDPVALFREETGSNVFVAGRLICDAGGCGWEIDPALRLEPAGEAGDASLLTRAASGIPVLVVPGILPSGTAGLEIAWPGGNAWVKTRPTVFTAAARTGEGLVVAVYRGHAAAAAYRAAGRSMDEKPALRFVTASLKVDYLRPTPLGIRLEVRGRVKEIKGRKVIVEATVSADGAVCARGEVVAVQMPEHMMPKDVGG